MKSKRDDSRGLLDIYFLIRITKELVKVVKCQQLLEIRQDIIIYIKPMQIVRGGGWSH